MHVQVVVLMSRCPVVIYVVMYVVMYVLMMS